MEFARDALLLLHLVGFAALFGGAFVQLRDDVKVVNSAMLHGALTQVVSGLLLVGVIEGAGDDIDSVKIGVKLAVALVVGVLCWVNRRKEAVPHGLFWAVALLTLANAAVAVFW
jgi:hypothetical protein